MKEAQKHASMADTGASRSIVLGTAGHIDHGKTALVYALTGTDTDRLPEEKSRGITIDLGFAAMRLQDADGTPIELSLIDVPGHHAFVRNMLAGAGGIDCVMLVVAADEGVKAQTMEHLAICTLLDIRRGVVVLTKEDAVSPERLEQARAEVAQLVQHTFLEGAPVVAVSAHTRRGIVELKQQLAKLAAKIPQRSTDSIARLPLDRAFSVRGFGTVVTGTLQAGVIRAGQSALLLPEQRTVRIRGVQVHGKAREAANAPNRVALNLAGLEVAEVQRGDTLVPPDTLEAVTVIDAEITMLPGMPPLKHRSRVRVHAFTADALATVLIFGSKDAAAEERHTPSPPGVMLVRLRLAKPMLVLPGDRFVVRQASPAMTIAGGRVLDAHPQQNWKKAASLAWLQKMLSATVTEQVLLRVQRRGTAGVSLREMVSETGLTADALRKTMLPMVHEGQLVAAGSRSEVMDFALTGDALSAAMDLVLKELTRAKGAIIARAELISRTRLKDRVFELALEKLQRGKRVAVAPAGLSLPVQESSVAATPNKRLAEVEAVYQAAGLASPILSEIEGKLRIAPKELSALITMLLRGKKLVRMGADNLFIHAHALEALAASLRAHRGESFDVARFKSFTKLTRKHAIPVLEYLDGARITRNNGGVRVVL